MLDLFDLAGRVAVVTGSSRGIGKAIAEALAAHGAAVILNANRDAEATARAASELSGRYNVPVTYVLGDIAKPETSANLAKAALTQHKRLDVWVNNAGVLIDALIGMIPQQDVDKTLGANVAGVLYGTQAAARVMQRRNSGSIVNLTSIIGRFGNEGQLVYGASKAAVIGATLSAAKELAPKNIRVNAIAPGFIETDMIKNLSLEKRAERVASIRIGRIGTPEDIANTALFLASDLSSYVTGQVIGVDGGMSI
ncbi:MAG: glucose 1-dehydrogenase [Methylocystis sp.]